MEHGSVPEVFADLVQFKQGHGGKGKGVVEGVTGSEGVGSGASNRNAESSLHHAHQSVQHRSRPGRW